MKISAIVPVYDNETTVDHVIKVLKSCNVISEIIVINDFSQEKSREILTKIKGIKLINREKNLGKGAGIADGWIMANNDVLLTVDADLSKLTLIHLNDLINEFKTEKWDMVIGWHDPSSFFDWYSGQRIYRKSVVMPYFNLAYKVGNGIEQVINFAYRGKRVGFIHTKNIGHILKYQRSPFLVVLKQYFKEFLQLIWTEYLIRFKCVDL